MSRLTHEQAAILALLERVQALEDALRMQMADNDVLRRRILRLEAAAGVPALLLVHPDKRAALTANPKKGRISSR